MRYLLVFLKSTKLNTHFDHTSKPKHQLQLGSEDTNGMLLRSDVSTDKSLMKSEGTR